MRPMCEGKKKYLDKATADMNIAQFKPEKDRRPRYQMRAYQCPICTFWHVGHDSRERK
jgi:hypothetical protein